MNIESFIIEDIDSFENLLAILNSDDKGYLCLDLETDSAMEKLAKVHGIGLCLNPDEAFYIPVRNSDKNLLWDEEQLEYIYSSISEVAKKRGLIGWNLIYDCLVWEYNSGIDISASVYCDVILLKHSVNEERPNGLKEVAERILGNQATKAQETLHASIKANGGSTTKDNMEMFKADPAILAEYCMWDVSLTYRLFEIFLPQLIEQGLEKFFFEDEVMPLFDVTLDMKKSGFPVDVPYFKKLHEDIEQDISELENEILRQTAELVAPFAEGLLEEEFPCKRTGNFPKMLAKISNLPLPEKDGKITLAKKELEKLRGSNDFYDWLLGDNSASPTSTIIHQTQYALFFDKNPDRKHVFNLNSNDHLGWLFFTQLGLKPLSKTKGGKPQCDADFLETIRSKYPFVDKLIDYKQLQKLDSTYILGILDRQIDGILYSSMLQFGTTSGRYSSTNPNLQNQPRVKGEDSDLTPMVLKYANGIRAGMIAPKGYKLVDLDYSALEPRCFADQSGDDNLKKIFFSGEDMYSSIAKRVYNYGDEVSSFKKDKNFLGNLHPEQRQIIKAMALAVTYGAEARRIADLLGIPKQEAAQIVEDYLDAYPGLRKYIETCHREANTQGYVRTSLGRIRHLPHVKSIYGRHGDKIRDYRYANKMGLKDVRRMYKTGLNNSCNTKIQGLAGHIINRAMVAIRLKFKERNIDGRIALMIHDQIVAIVREDQAEEAKIIMKDLAENTTKISVPLIVEPKIASNLRDSH
jgi:DNA polymerase I-like protein with 3'-5' exonuclease and polymerase domains